jgi:hypothetical protein
MRASAPDFAEKFNILRQVGLPPGDDQIEGLGPGKREKMLIVDDALDPPAFAGQNTREQFIDIAAGFHYERGFLCGGSSSVAAVGRHE